MLHNPAIDAAPQVGGIERVAEIAALHAAEVDRDGRFPHEAAAAMREEGLLGTLIPADLGGGGASIREVARQTQRLARACASTAMAYAMHHSQMACVVAHALHEPWHRDFARRVATDQLLVASITSEIGIGGDMRSSKCAVERDGDRFTLAKEAPTVSYGAFADVFLVTARSGADAPPSDQVLVTVMRDEASHGEPTRWDALGLRGTASGGFSFRGAGAAEQIMSVPFATIAAETMVPTSHFLWAAAWTGIAADALTRARAYLRAQARRSRGATPPGANRLMRGIGLLELMQARLAAMIDDYDACTVFGGGASPAGWPADMAHAATLNTLKRDLSELGHQIVVEAMMICGMSGYRNDTEFSIGRHLRDILAGQLMISNDRITATTGTLLLAQRTPLGTL